MRTTAFPKILHLGRKQVKDIFDGEVEITEKVDGSQLGFGKINGELFVRSKGKEQDLDNPDKMFEGAVEFVKTIADKLPDNITLYGEWLSKPKHNILAYDRTPKNGIALFGVYNPETQEHAGMDTISEWAERLGVDTVPLLEKFKEVHAKGWKKEHTGKGRLEVAISQYRSEARWNKAIQHLRESGELTDTPVDIGRLIKEELWDIYKDDFLRNAVFGLPEWYKKKLALGDDG